MSWVWTILMGRKPRRTLIRCVVLAAVCVFVFGSVVQPAVVDGFSMEPTIPHRGFRFVYLQAYRREPPLRFDIVAVRVVGDRMYYLKRVLGLPGESVDLRDGKLFINGEYVDEPHVAYRGNWFMTERELGPDEYFIAGDNRSMPIAYHKVGVTRRRHIAGRLL